MTDRDSQQLAAKDAGLFRQVVKYYESKQYKKGIKAADQVRSILLLGLEASNNNHKACGKTTPQLPGSIALPCMSTCL